jgi:predicted nucleic acid-binding Zn ribbon protein
MIQPYLFRDALSIECILCGASIQEGDSLHAPKAESICEECEDRQHKMEVEYAMAMEMVPGMA